MTAGYLGSRSGTGFLNPENPIASGSWSVQFGPADLVPSDFEVYHIALLGPGGPFRVYLDSTFYSTSPRGDINEYDPTHPMYVRRGQTIWFHWQVATGSAPQVTIFARQPGGVLT